MTDKLTRNRLIYLVHGKSPKSDNNHGLLRNLRCEPFSRSILSKFIREIFDTERV